MSRTRTKFICQECGATALRWLGRCPDCGRWNTMVEEIVVPEAPSGTILPPAEPRALVDVRAEEAARFRSLVEEFDQVLGGGIVPGSLVLVGGPPGIGKSTLLLQVAQGVGSQSGKVLYISGEESPHQVKMRSDRLGVNNPGIFILSEVNLDQIRGAIERMMPSLVVVDSIQTVYLQEIGTAPGSVAQVRECASHLLRLGKSLGIAIILVGHVTKEGAIAGPRVLEHLVDTVLYFEGESFQNFRVLRSIKNRFGSTNEVGIFEMGPAGLDGVRNPSQLFLSQRSGGISGTVVIPVLEGTRPLLVELQALVSRTYYGIPARRAKGVDLNRLALMLAVLEKRAGIPLSTSDVFINVVGGVNAYEPAIELGLAMAVASSFTDHPVDPGTVILGEVGLGGEVRPVPQLPKRLAEAEKMGFTRCVLSARNLEGRDSGESRIKLVGTETVREALNLTLGRILHRTRDRGAEKLSGAQFAGKPGPDAEVP